MLAFAGLVLTILAVARRMGCGLPAARFAAVAYAATMLLFTHYVGIDDPQLLGHAIATPAILLLLREPRHPAAIPLAARLLTLAVFVKHNLVALPLALAIWLALRDRCAAGQLLLAGTAFAAFGAAACAAAFGPDMLHQLLDRRSYRVAHALARFASWLQMGGVPLVLAAALAMARPWDRHVGFTLLYAAVAVLLGAWLGGGAGVDLNIMFDTQIALALAGALLLDRHPQWRTTVALISIAPIIAWIAVAAWTDRLRLHPYRDGATADRTCRCLPAQPAGAGALPVLVVVLLGLEATNGRFVHADTAVRPGPAGRGRARRHVGGQAVRRHSPRRGRAWPFVAVPGLAAGAGRGLSHPSSRQARRVPGAALAPGRL